MASDRYGGYLARKQTHIHKLAIVCAASRDDKLTILPEHLIEAEALLNSVEPHMQKVFESIGMVDEARKVREILAFVKSQGWITTDNLWRLVQNIMNQREFTEALSAAIRGGQLSVERREGRAGVINGSGGAAKSL
jgi:hypothetical protein